MIFSIPWEPFVIMVAVMVGCCYLAVRVLQPRPPKYRHQVEEGPQTEFDRIVRGEEQ